MQFSIFTLQIQVVWFGSMIVGQQIAALLDKAIQKQQEKKVDTSQVSEKKVEFKTIQDDSPRKTDDMKDNLID